MTRVVDLLQYLLEERGSDLLVKVGMSPSPMAMVDKPVAVRQRAHAAVAPEERRLVGIGGDLIALPLALGDQIALLLILLLTSKGAAGVSGAAFVVLAAKMRIPGSAVTVGGMYEL